ncbi:proteophosphoglycan ppg4 [Angomonas deanei]|uniref:Uncharacterized protein n=1 Tax=Angomonas deanei TaxID=59799 RepID=A0A7G2CGB9_9TRYP|nr:proteophosphoglycan ppg4 [Angomonas deanei]CAD2218405.1 hypothetical protein, conserved [Angomonas deanei]|eukprot:EPY22123.1 proteophosphoglycan ppg4 [Angomonas deanei]
MTAILSDINSPKDPKMESALYYPLEPAELERRRRTSDTIWKVNPALYGDTPASEIIADEPCANCQAARRTSANNSKPPLGGNNVRRSLQLTPLVDEHGSLLKPMPSNNSLPTPGQRYNSLGSIGSSPTQLTPIRRDSSPVTPKRNSVSASTQTPALQEILPELKEEVRRASLNNTPLQPVRPALRQGAASAEPVYRPEADSKAPETKSNNYTNTETKAPVKPAAAPAAAKRAASLDVPATSKARSAPLLADPVNTAKPPAPEKKAAPPAPEKKSTATTTEAPTRRNPAPTADASEPKVRPKKKVRPTSSLVMSNSNVAPGSLIDEGPNIRSSSAGRPPSARPSSAVRVTRDANGPQSTNTTPQRRKIKRDMVEPEQKSTGKPPRPNGPIKRRSTINTITNSVDNPDVSDGARPLPPSRASSRRASATARPSSRRASTAFTPDADYYAGNTSLDSTTGAPMTLAERRERASRTGRSASRLLESALSQNNSDNDIMNTTYDSLAHSPDHIDRVRRQSNSRGYNR